jgi:type I restriction enzyme M protein
MTYWLETMKDDVYMIVENGWEANSELIPAELVVNKYFKSDKEIMEQLEIERDEMTRQREEFEEENSGDEGFLEELKNDKGKITKGNVQNRIREIRNKNEFEDEIKILNDYLAIIDKESKANKKVNNAQKELNKKVENKYKVLTADEVKTLVVDDKWMTSIISEINGEMDRISQNLTSRIKELAERYAEPLPQIEKEVEECEAKVKAHLERMGFKW